MKKLLISIPLIIIFLHIFMNVDAGPQVWTTDTSIPSGVCNFGIVVNPTNPTIMYAGAFTGGVYKSTNSGVTWAQSNSGISGQSVYCMAISASNPSTVYAGTTANGIYKSTDDGATWNAFNTGITQSPNYIQAIGVNPTDPNKICIGIWDGSTTIDAAVGLFRTTNGGTTWAASNSGMLANKNILSLTINPMNPSIVYAGTSFAGGVGPCYVYKSYDGGATWVNSSTGFGQSTTDTDPIRCMSMSTIDTGRILAGRFWNTAGGGPWLTTNSGASWTQISGGIVPATFPGSLVRSVLIRPGSNNEFFFGGDPTTQQPGGVWYSTNAGGLWSGFNGGTMQSTYVVRSLNWRVTDNTLFAGVAGTSGQGVYEYTFLPLGISGNNGSIPKTFNLSQNYPNPFNPSTVIQFAVPKSSFVTLKIYDMSGREVKTLVNESRTAGNYQVSFNASNLASGVYLYTIVAGDFRDTKKMILVK